MKAKASPPKGSVLEELLRAYFLRSGFFVVRGVPFQFAGEDLTDVDLWLYERPTGTARRIQICDIKYKARPKAVERLFWTNGLADALEVDGAYVATTDKRAGLREIADRLDIQLIDGNDIARIQKSQAVLFPDRLTDEELVTLLQTEDRASHKKFFGDARKDIISSLSEGFGPPSAVRALSSFARMATAVVESRPNSDASKVAGRLAYLAAALVCASLDYASVDAAFRPADERRNLMLDAVRLGALSDDGGRQSLKIALALVAKYAPGGSATAAATEAALKRDLESIPAEIIADQAMRLLKNDQLFSCGRELEYAAYQTYVPNFDSLDNVVKSMLGALLDYSGVERERFANAWDVPTSVQQAPIQVSLGEQTSLFGDAENVSTVAAASSGAKSPG